MTEQYFRNIYAYRNDCERQGIAPRLPQLLLMQHRAQISVLPAWVPESAPEAIKRWAGWVYGLLVGVWWGEWVCGMRGSYGEYYQDHKDNGKIKVK